MSWSDVLLWGFVATLLLTLVLSGAKGLGLTRMDIPFMLGTMFTRDRDRARWLGFLVHLLNGWLFAIFYLLVFFRSDQHHWAAGAVIGLLHGLFALTVLMSMLPSIHPRMASESHGPDPTRMLAPPGFLAKNYGNQTAVSTLVAHILYGVVLGLFHNVQG